MTINTPADVFPGGVPPRVVYDQEAEQIVNLVDQAEACEEPWAALIPEVALIALAARFGGFCNRHVATVVDMYPPCLERLQAKGENVLPFTDRLSKFDQRKPGLTVAEHFNTTSLYVLNALLETLLGIEVFARPVVLRFNELVNDTELLASVALIRPFAFMEHGQPVDRGEFDIPPKTITVDEFHDWVVFLEELVETVTMKTVEVLSKRDWSGIDRHVPRLEAFELLTWRRTKTEA